MNLNDVSPKILTLSAVAVGYLLIDDLDSNEQNALGNWLMLSAQVLCTNAYFKQLQGQKAKEMSEEDTITILNKMVVALKKEIDMIKEKIK